MWQKRQHAASRTPPATAAAHVHEGRKQQQRGLRALAVHVVFDDHLHAELGMPGQRDHQQDGRAPPTQGRASQPRISSYDCSCVAEQRRRRTTASAGSARRRSRAAPTSDRRPRRAEPSPSTLPSGATQAHRVTGRQCRAAEPHHQRREQQRRDDHHRAAAPRLRALQAAAGIPDQVTDAIAEVVDEGERETRPAVVWRPASTGNCIAAA